MIQKKYNHGFILENPISFILGLLTGIAPIILYLVLTKSFNDFFKWCFVWAYEYQIKYPPFSWTKAFIKFFSHYNFYFFFAFIGIIYSLSVIFKFKKKPTNEISITGRELLLLTSLVTTFFSFSLQRAPWDYSMLPFIGILTIYSTRGIGLLIEFFKYKAGSLSKTIFFILFSFLLLLFLLIFYYNFVDKLEKNNIYQLDTLNLINKITKNRDVFYDNSGSFVSRPHAYFYFYTEASIRKFQADKLINEIPSTLEEKGVMAVIRDKRFDSLPSPLKSYIFNNYQPYNGDILLWGKKLKSPGQLKVKIIADDQYFIAIKKHDLQRENQSESDSKLKILINGKEIEGQKIFLTKSLHTFEIEGYEGPIYLLWLPRNGKRWMPKHDSQPKFSTIF